MPIWPDDNLIFSILLTWLMTRKGWASVLLLSFTLVHIHIYPKLSFSIKTLPSNPLSCLADQKERRFWLIPVNCWGFPLRLSVAAFESGAHQIYLLSWVSMGLLLFGFAKLIDLGLLPSRILILDYSHQESILAFSCDERHLVPCAECWCERLHEVLLCLELWALALTALTFFLFFCLDWPGDWSIVLLWLFLSKKFSYFSECTECPLTESLVLQGTVAALMMALIWHSHCFECLFSQLASSFLMMWWLIWMWSRQPEWTSPFDKLVVAAKMRTLLSRSLSEVWHISSGHFVWCGDGNVWRGKFPDLTRASLGGQGSDVDHCLASAKHGCPTGRHNKRMEAFSHWWLKASAFWFMD